MASKRILERQARAAEAVKAAFVATGTRLAETGFPAWISQTRFTYRVRKAPNGTVDGQALIENLPSETDTARILLELEQARIFVAPARFKTAWVQIGFIGAFEDAPVKKRRRKGDGEIRSSESQKKRDYDRYAGQDRVVLNSQAQSKIAGHLLTARDVAGRLDNRNKKPTAIFIRWYWSPSKSRPRKRR